MKKALIFVLFVVGLSGCGILNFPSLNAPKPPDQVYSYHQTIENQPQIVQTADGKSFVWESQKQTIDANYERKDKPLTWWQKVCNWFANLGILGILGTIASIIIAPGGTIAWLFAEKNKIMTALKQTVKGIDDSQVVKNSPQVAQALSASQDAKTKALIDDIQQPGK